MTDAPNRREDYRAELDQPGTITIDGRELTCHMVDLSAGGVALLCPEKPEPDSKLHFVVALPGELLGGRGTIDLESDLSLVAAVPKKIEGAQMWCLRCRFSAGRNASVRDLARRVVFAEQRRALAAQSGAEGASPMVSDSDRRRRLTEPAAQVQARMLERVTAPQAPVDRSRTDRR